MLQQKKENELLITGKKPAKEKVQICVPPTPDGTTQREKEKETTANLF